MLSPVSIQAFKLNNKGYSIRVEDEQLIITKDGEETDVSINCIYTKPEVDNLIAGGGGADPNYLRNICLTAVNTILQGLNSYNSLTYSTTDGRLNLTMKDVKHASDALLELWQWTNGNMYEIDLAHNALQERVNSIKECHCMDQGGFHEQVTKQINDLSSSVSLAHLHDVDLLHRVSSVSNYLWCHNMFLTLPSTQKITQVYTKSKTGIEDFLYSFWAPINENKNEENPDPVYPDYPVVDPSQEIVNLDIPVVDDPYEREFDEKKPVYGTLTIPFDIQVNGLINGVDITDIQPGPSPEPTPGESYFKKIEGYDYFYVKNENIDITDYTYNNIVCHKLAVNGISASTMRKLKTVTEELNVLRFILRKNEIFDDSGTYIKEFYCFVENKRLFCPVITLSSTNDATHYVIDCVEISFDEDPFIAFDKNISFEPYTLFLRGEISVMYLLPQDTIESIIPEVRCDIITARNALTLHESNVAYLYKPSRIYENNDNYIMTFHIDSDFVIPTNMTFTFNEFCFMNNWTLTWTGTEWIGNNIQGRSNGKMKNQLNRLCDESDYIVAIGIVKSDFNNLMINTFLGGVVSDSVHQLKNIIDRHQMAINGVYDNGEDFSVSREGLAPLKSVLRYNNDFMFESSTAYPVYDDIYACPVAIYIDVDYHKLDSFKNAYINHIQSISLDLNVNGVSNKYTFRLTSTELKDLNRDWGYALRIAPINDTVDELNVLLQKSNIDKLSKDVTLYLDKSTLRPRDEINWDPKTNPFQYIIDQQFYSITPNPNAATTLYTDYNITSSKIITADNITTMRSDLNIVANTTDVISFDVKAIEKRCDNIETEVKQVKDVVQHIEKEIKTLKIEAGFAIGLSALSVVAPYIPKALELGGNYIKMGWNYIRNISNGYTRIASSEGEVEMTNFVLTDALENRIWTDDEPFFPPTPLTLNVRESEEVDLSPLIHWTNEGHIDPKYGDWVETGEEDCNNPDNMYVSYSAVQNTCMYYRDSLKPAFKLVCNKLNEVSDNLINTVKFNDFVELGEEVPEIVWSSHNTRMWIKFKNEIKEGEINFRVTWLDSESDFDDMKLVLNSVYNEYRNRVSLDITEFTCVKHPEETSRFEKPYFEGENTIIIDMKEEYNVIELLSSSVKVFIEQDIENIVYRDSFDELNERVKKLENGGSGGLMKPSDDFERRLAVLEAKCRNIHIDGEDEINVMSNETLTIEERLQILERKCSSIKI